MAEAPARRKGCLIIIGGHEDRDPEGECLILSEIARRLRGGRLVLATVASREPEGYYEEYSRAFAKLGVEHLDHLYVGERSEAGDRDKLQVLDDAAGVFFTGGDQLRITSQIGDSGIEAKVRAIHERGGVIAGTSAGASVMSEIMLVRGTGAVSHRIGDLQMAAGLRLVRNVIIDQHFAERGRFGRLAGAVAYNPRELGLGLDEDTAILVEEERFRVIGSGAVYVFDGSSATYSNVAEADPDAILSLHGITVHVLAAGDGFDLARREPIPASR